jgi:hypothetical protein
MGDMKLLRDLTASSCRHAVLTDTAEAVMRAARDPLLLHEHLQSCERGKLDVTLALPEGTLEASLNGIEPTVARLDYGRDGETSENRYAPGERLFLSSLRPEAFKPTGEDRRASLDHEQPGSEELCVASSNLMGSILAALGIVLAGACLFDFLVG